MREIMFRGKRTDNGEWAYGFPFSYQARLVVEGIETWDGERHKIDPSTVGQYTGLKDRNGKKIFEGDILLPPGEDAANLRLVVAFERGCWTLRVPGWGWLFDTPLYEFGGEVYLKLGNIHDNPEMLEVSSQ